MDDIMWGPFILASLVIITIPGQDMLLVMTKSISRGTGAGVITAAGVSTGLTVHTLVVAFGLGGIILASEIIFNAIKITGAIYLFYLAWKLLRSDGTFDITLDKKYSESSVKTFFNGALSNASNPKIIIFYLSFLPQFAGSNSHMIPKLIMLGLSFAVITFLLKAPIAIFSGLLSGWLKSRPSLIRWIMRTGGIVMFLIGLKVLTEKAPSS